MGNPSDGKDFPPDSFCEECEEMLIGDEVRFCNECWDSERPWLKSLIRQLFDALSMQRPDADYESDDEWKKCVRIRQEAMEAAVKALIR